MKTIQKLLAFFLSLFVLSACQSDYDKYFAILSKAGNSSVTELETPEGLNFEMDEQDFYDKLKALNPSQDKCYVWLIDNDTIVGEFQGYNFYEGKLCRYEIWIGETNENELPQLVNYYKAKLKNYEYDHLPDLDHPSHIWSKGNIVFRIKELHLTFDQSTMIIVECENRPVSANLEKEKREKYESSITHHVEVNNNKWDGGVKQVKDYLIYSYLKDPDSYKSIEWSEVKRKDDGYYVRHKYRAKNGFGGYVVSNQLFHLDFSGNVIDVKDLY